MTWSSSSWPTSSLFGWRLTDIDHLHRRYFMFLVKNHLNILSRINNDLNAINSNSSLSNSRGKYKLMFTSSFKYLFLISRWYFPMKGQNRKYSTIQLFLKYFNKLTNFLNSRTKTEKMSFVLLLHAILISQNLLFDDSFYFPNCLKLVFFYVQVISVVYWNWIHASTYFQCFCREGFTGNVCESK